MCAGRALTHIGPLSRSGRGIPGGTGTHGRDGLAGGAPDLAHGSPHCTPGRCSCPGIARRVAGTFPPLAMSRKLGTSGNGPSISRAGTGVGGRTSGRSRTGRVARGLQW